jgi:N-acetyl-anhydromuramyl-L-alanine amidase AmpD
MVGNFDTRRPDGGQWNLCQKLCKSLMDIFKIPAENVQGHNEYAPYKTCPGRMFDMYAFRQGLK